MITREEREELKKLSKEILGTPSKWCDLHAKGYLDKKNPNKTVPVTYNRKWLLTFYEIKEFLLQVKTEQEEVLKKLKEQSQANAAARITLNEKIR